MGVKISKLSENIGKLAEALKTTSEDYRKDYTSRLGSLQDLYGSTLRKLVKEYDFDKEKILGTADDFFGKKNINFLAVDGTSYRERGNGFAIFFSASLGVKGNLDLETRETVFENTSFKDNISMIAYIPIPYSQLLSDEEDEDQRLTLNDDERIDTSRTHNKVMQLAEIYLPLDKIRSGMNLDLLLMDRSLSSLQAGTRTSPRNLEDIGLRYEDREMDRGDVFIAYSYIRNEELDIPSKWRYRASERILKALETGETYSLEELSEEIDFDKEIVEKIVSDEYKNHGTVVYDEDEDEIRLKEKYLDSWDKTKDLFYEVCDSLLKEHDPYALRIEKGGTKRWLTPDEIDLLSYIGLTLLIQKCWENDILALGICKDSSVTYFRNHYLPILCCKGYYGDYEENLSKLNDTPSTDRLLFEALPRITDLGGVWTSVEFDSCFSTLQMESEDGRPKFEDGRPCINALRGYIVAPERLFLKSYGQFYSSEDGEVKGHVLVLDRLVYPGYDYNETLELELDKGKVEPLLFENNEKGNRIQDLSSYIIKSLCSNRIPEAIGYPDPLYNVDKIAKSFLDMNKKMISSSKGPIMLDPMSKTLRQMREEAERERRF